MIAQELLKTEMETRQEKPKQPAICGRVLMLYWDDEHRIFNRNQTLHSPRGIIVVFAMPGSNTCDYRLSWQRQIEESKCCAASRGSRAISSPQV